MKKIIKILLYLSIAFVVYYLYKFDYLLFSKIEFNYFLLTLSLFFLWTGFIASTFSWKRSLAVHNIFINRGMAIYSHGISVFAKYIPGKLWVIIGRASIVSEKKSRLSELSAISLKEQLIYLLTGLIVSSIGLIWIKLSFVFVLIVLLTVCFLLVFLFSKKVHQVVIALLERILRKTISVPYVSLKETIPMLQSILLYWFLWSLGFYLLILSVAGNIPFSAIFAFPLSVCYGLLAVVVPGGIGVRESIIVFVLTSIGVDASLAITLSIIQRLWFISGEIFIFGLALINKKSSVRR